MQQYHLHLKGFVGGSDFDKSHVDEVLTENAGKPVTVLIDSLGGSLATALSIAAAFRNHGDVTVHFVGFNASAATIASMGAQHISMDAHAMYLVHQCSTQFFEWASMNASDLQKRIEDLEKAKSDLEKMDANVASMYSAKCKKPCADLLMLMKQGGWLTAQEALDWGFVDELTDQAEDEKPILTDAVASAMASVGMPIPNTPSAVEQQSQFAKFLNALTSFFRTQAPEPQASAQTESKPEAQTQTKEPEAQPKQPTITMNKLFTLLAAALAVEALQFQDGVCAMTEAQCQALEGLLKRHADEAEQAQANLKEKTDALAERDKTIADLQEQITAQAELLAKQPGDTSSQVLNNGKPGNEPKDEVTEYLETNSSASALFDRLP